MNKLFLILPLLLGACTPGESSYKQTKPVKEVVLEGLRRPWSMAFLSENEALVTEKDGNLLKVNLLTKERMIIEGIPDDRVDSVVTKVEDATSLHYPFGIPAGLKKPSTKVCWK